MKKLLVLAMVLAAALVPAQVQAGPIGGDGVQVGDILTLSDYFNTHPGGPFTVNNQNPEGSDGWLTFCAEAEGSLVLDQAILLVTGIGTKVQDSGRELVPEVAFLYTKYRAMGGSTNVATNNDYQNAIGYFMGGGGGFNALVALAMAAVLPGGDWYGMGLANVAVVNLVYGQTYGSYLRGSNAQDILTFVPDGGATLMLLGGALLGLGALRRKFNS